MVHKMTPLDAPYVDDEEDMFLYYSDEIQRTDSYEKLTGDLDEIKEPYIEGDESEIITHKY